MHPAVQQVETNQALENWDVFLFNTKKALRTIIGNLLLSIIFLPMSGILFTQFPGDLEAQIPGLVVGMFGLIMLVNFFRHLHWLQTKQKRKIIITDSEIIRQWGEKISSWNISEITTHISSVQGQETGRTVRLDLVYKKTGKREFLTDDHWIGNTDLIAHAIIKKIV